MKLGEECRTCLLNSQSKKVQSYLDTKLKEEFIKRITCLCQNYSSEGASPLLMREINNVHKEVFSYPLDYSKEKEKYNKLCLSYENEIEKMIYSSSDPLEMAIKFAQVGNLIDFAKLTSIDINLLDYFKEQVNKQHIDEKVLSMSRVW